MIDEPDRTLGYVEPELAAEFPELGLVYTEAVAEPRRSPASVRERLRDAAREAGANAVIAMRFDCNELGSNMTEVAAYGTAVTVQRDS